MTVTVFGKKFNYRYLVHTRRYALIAAGLVVFTLSVVVFLIFPQVNGLVDMYGKLQSTQKTISQLESKSQQLQRLPQSQLFTSGIQIHSVLPSRKPLLELLSAMNEVAGASGVTYSELSLSPGKVASEGATLSTTKSPAGGQGSRPTTTARSTTGVSGSEALVVNLKVTGSLANINIFLRDIERVAPLTTVTKLSLIERTGTKIDPNAAFEAELQIETYFFTQAVATTLSAPVPQLTVDQQLLMNEITSYRYPVILSQDAIRGGGLQDLFGVEELQVVTQ